MLTAMQAPTFDLSSFDLTIGANDVVFWIAGVAVMVLLRGGAGFVLGLAIIAGSFLLGPWSVLLLLVAATPVLVKHATRQVPEGHVQLVERFGRYRRTLAPGLNVIVPLLDTIRTDATLYTYLKNGEQQAKLIKSDGSISMKEYLLDPRELQVIAGDNAVVFVDSIAYFRIVDAARSVYGVGNLGEAISKLLETTLRQEIAHLNSDALLTSRDIIGAKLQEALERASDVWGLKIMRVEIQGLRFEDKVQSQLNEARAAELEYRAQVVKAQRDKETALLEAEAAKQSEILQAQGHFEASRLAAEGQFLLESRKREGEAKGLTAIALAMVERPESLVALQALEAQKSVAESFGRSNNTMILPAESAGLFGALGAVVKGWSFLHQERGGNASSLANGSGASITLSDAPPSMSTERA